ncbi:hypothetical protein [Nitrosospira sp. Nsp14]|uniref:hypothetical protein n=1 Tax=Nitrosospira sp. Nsp14 TaxID=1855333 RepID=UPI000B896F1A|nr:hypothetical protein [Nitrosospira sp. Nsp14]
MTLDELLTSLERRGGDTPDTPGNLVQVSAKAAQTGVCTPDTPDTRQHISAEVVVPNQGTTSQWWRFHYAQGDSKEASYSPAATHAEAMSGEPDAIKAEPFEPLLRQPRAPLSQEEEAILLDWLGRIGETDEVLINAMLHQCQTDQDARDFFIGLAEQ